MDSSLIPDAGPNGSWSDLTGHVAVVTGGNSGIGLGYAGGLVAAGATVTIWGRNEAKNAAAVEQLSGGRGSVTASVCDVADEQAVTAAMVAIADTHGRLDSCFVNAGIGGITHPLLETDLERFHHITRVDLDGAFVTLREAARHMVRFGNGGSLVATGSVVNRFGAAFNYGYGASKAALSAMVRGCAVELARHKIRANTVSPGWTESDMTSNGAFQDERFVQGVMPRMPVRRWGEAGDFGAVAVYLASPASSFHTGDEITIDGGYACF
jgi:NAD(P)-dependent dehydrogenase (short-subunit alcohol dehydrogenase family)